MASFLSPDSASVQSSPSTRSHTDLRMEPEFRSVSTSTLSVIQVLSIIGYAVCTFVLPETTSVFKAHTVRLFPIHAAATLVVFACAPLIQRSHRNMLSLGYLDFNKDTRLYRHAPIVITTVTNLVLLYVASMDEWFARRSDRTQLTSSALLAVRGLAIVEALITLGFGIVYMIRVRRHNKKQPLPDRRFVAPSSSVNRYQPPGGAAPPVSSGDTPSTPSQAPFSQQRANEVIAYLHQREDDLMFQVTNLQQQLEAALSQQSQLPSEAAGQLRAQQREYHETVALNRELEGKLKAAETEVGWHQQELRKSAAELQRLRGFLREERRKNEKLQLTLEIEKEANSQAQRVIEGIRNMDASDMSDGGVRTSDYGSYSPPPPPAGFGGRERQHRPPRP